MSELADALSNALDEAQADRPCGCKDAAPAADPFGADYAMAGGDLAAQLNAALDGLSGLGEANLFAPLDVDLQAEMAFADLGESTGLTLEQILEALEKKPGLKVTLSY